MKVHIWSLHSNFPLESLSGRGSEFDFSVASMALGPYSNESNQRCFHIQCPKCSGSEKNVKAIISKYASINSAN